MEPCDPDIYRFGPTQNESGDFSMHGLAIALLIVFPGFQVFALWMIFSYNRERERFDAKNPVPSPPPGISILVPIKGPVAHIEETLGGLLAQDYPGEMEVVLAF